MFEKIGSEYYYINGPQAVSWYSALHNCHRIGAQLISVARIETLYEIQSHRQNTTYRNKYWVDLNDLATEGDYVSISTGLKPTFEHWCENEEPPMRSRTKNCVNIEQNNASGPCMKSVSCNGLKDYICQLHTPHTISIVAF